jgi:hypothetical protein
MDINQSIASREVRSVYWNNELMALPEMLHDYNWTSTLYTA